MTRAGRDQLEPWDLTRTPQSTPEVSRFRPRFYARCITTVTARHHWNKIPSGFETPPGFGRGKRSPDGRRGPFQETPRRADRSAPVARHGARGGPAEAAGDAHLR